MPQPFPRQCQQHSGKCSSAFILCRHPPPEGRKSLIFSVPSFAPRLGAPWSTRTASSGDVEQDRKVALPGACVPRASLPRWEPTGLQERKPCQAENPWGCLHATSVETEGWRGCSCGMAALPSPSCHARVSIPTLELPSGGNISLESLTEGALWRMELCRGRAGRWHSTGFLLEPQTDTETSERAKPPRLYRPRPWAVRASCRTCRDDQYSFFSPA